MALSCCRSDPQRTPQTTEEKRRHRTECDRACRTVKTAEQKEHRVGKPRTTDKARCAAHAVTEVVSSIATPR